MSKRGGEGDGGGGRGEAKKDGEVKSKLAFIMGLTDRFSVISVRPSHTQHNIRMF